MASTKREPPVNDSVEPETKKAKNVSDTAESSAQPESHPRVVLNPADSDLDFNIEASGLEGSGLHEQGFAYCWTGARANVGITGAKYCFGFKIISNQPVDMEDTSLDQQHVCRLGISRGDDKVGNLGESENSFGFGGTGKFSNAGKFSNYGEKFGVGDTIVCAVNLENKPSPFIGFSKNGKWLGTARYFNAGSNGLGIVDSPIRKLQWESALFPHVLLKNVVVVAQFSLDDGLVPEEGYKPWASALEDGNGIMGPIFQNPRDCEVMMMVGLPASGKSTWAEKWVKEHPEKRYVLLGTNLALDQMKVPGLLRKNNYGERFDLLMDRATGIFNTLLSRAAKTPRNYILDQTNVYKSARKRKLKPFADYQKIAVVVFPEPEELKARAVKRFKEMGKEVPAEAVNEMLANYVLPTSKDMPRADEFFDQVIFTELNRGETQKCLDEMKRALASGAKSVSPYSRESSVQSHNSSAMQNPGTYPGYSPCGPVSSGYQQSTYSTQPQLNYDNQVNSAYYGSGLSRVMDSTPLANQGYQTPPVLNAPYQSCDGYESRVANPGLGTDPYQTYGVGGPYHHPNIERRNLIPGGGTSTYQSGMVEPYSRPSFSTYGEHTGFPGLGISQGSLQASQSTFVPNPSPTYGRNCGSPYGTPVPRPPYANLPYVMQQPHGYAPPRPGYN
ncbi:hypothetical protein C3L33_15450, partial [Rhododendron williamsianum]